MINFSVRTFKEDVLSSISPKSDVKESKQYILATLPVRFVGARQPLWSASGGTPAVPCGDISSEIWSSWISKISTTRLNRLFDVLIADAGKCFAADKDFPSSEWPASLAQVREFFLPCGTLCWMRFLFSKMLAVQ